ncbi:hypothetical protein DRW03_21345 [Corallococcus sp. H22C18031201]|nr:hypothetical protein DRW03_21345 [Corallococcus sp. H22C18031201]
MPVIVAKKNGTCTADGCGGGIRRGEYVEFSAAGGARHLECSNAPQGRRVNLRAGTCACGACVPAREGSLVLAGESERHGRYLKRWQVRCARCGG